MIIPQHIRRSLPKVAVEHIERRVVHLRLALQIPPEVPHLHPMRLAVVVVADLELDRRKMVKEALWLPQVGDGGRETVNDAGNLGDLEAAVERLGGELGAMHALDILEWAAQWQQTQAC